jgi:hypothetical protein
VREAEEVECFRLPVSAPLPVLGREGPELQQARFLGMPLQVELPKPFGECSPESLGIRLDLASQHNNVSEAHDDDIAAVARFRRQAWTQRSTA